VRQALKSVVDDLGRRLAELRSERGWTQSTAAEHASMAEKDYQAIENGRRSVTLRTLVTLANAFDISVRALLDPPKDRGARKPGRPKKASPPSSPDFALVAEPRAGSYGKRPRRKPR
jgi:transcriptional regulator with XRE-family HTH domain